MNKQQPNQLVALLRAAMPPTECQNTMPVQNLWPAMQARLNAERNPEPPPQLLLEQVPWFDWVLAGAMAAFVGAFPATIPMLLYYL